MDRTIKVRLMWIFDQLKSKTIKFFNKNQKRHIFHDTDYLKKIFLLERKNIEALSFKEGVISAKWEDIQYFLLLDHGDFLESCVYMNGIWEGFLVKAISQYLKAENTIMIDIGANVGATSIPLARKHTNANIFCFEPHPGVYQRLKQNIAINQLKNITPVNKAVTQTQESITFYAQKKSNNMGLSSVKLNHNIKDYEEIKVSTCSIDDYFQDHKEPISVIKIDTQGSESDVLISAEKTIKKHRPVIFFEFEDEYFTTPDMRKKALDVIQTILIDQGYGLFSFHKEFDFLPKVNLDRYYHGDLVALPF